MGLSPTSKEQYQGGGADRIDISFLSFCPKLRKGITSKRIVAAGNVYLFPCPIKPGAGGSQIILLNLAQSQKRQILGRTVSDMENPATL